MIAAAAADVIPKRSWKLKSAIAVDSELMTMLQKDSNREEKIAAHEFFLHWLLVTL